MKQLYLLFVLFYPFSLYAQQKDSLGNIPSHYLSQVDEKAIVYRQMVDQQSIKLLDRLQKSENRIKRKLAKHHPAIADSIFSKPDHVNTAPVLKTTAGSYIDTLQTTLQYLQVHPGLLDKGPAEEIAGTLKHVQQLQESLQYAETVKRYIRERKELLQQQLAGYGSYGKELKQLNKQAYYYAEQLKEYKAMLKDKKKAESKAMEILKKQSAYKKFIAGNSQLAGLFPTGESLENTGLQSRAAVQQLISERLNIIGGPGNNPGSYMTGQLSAAQSQVSQLRNGINASGDGDMPDFRPNSQKVKSFFKRIETGFNLQTQQGGNTLPAISDIGLSAGYRINDKSVAGIGVAYRLGLGKPLKDITFSHQGISLRSYADIKLKKSTWISGGLEYNYLNAFRRVNDLPDLHLWQRSGLIGLSRKTQIGKKTVKAQLLWDFLSYSQIPHAQPIKFRIGYNLN